MEPQTFFCPATELSRFAFRTQEIARCEHPQTIDRLADKAAEIPAVKCEQDIRASKSRDKNWLVLANVEIEGPVKCKFIAFNNEPAT